MKRAALLPLLVWMMLFVFLHSLLGAENFRVTLTMEQKERPFMKESIDRMLNLYFSNEKAEIMQYGFRIGRDNWKNGFVCKDLEAGVYRLDASVEGLGYVAVEGVTVENGKNDFCLKFPNHEKNGLTGRIVFNAEKYSLIDADVSLTKKNAGYGAENRMPVNAWVSGGHEYEIINIPSGLYSIELRATLVPVQKKENYGKEDVMAVQMGFHERVVDGRISRRDIVIEDAALESRRLE